VTTVKASDPFIDPAPLLEPRSIAVVGANDRPASYADSVLRNLERAGFAGPVWGVNPNREEVHGRACFPSVLDLPEPADAVVVAIPAAKVPAAVAECVERSCGGAIVLSAGFGEVATGEALERELRETALAGGLPVCGPNGNGVVVVASRAPMWGDSVQPLRPGGVALISQSGNVAVNAIGSRRGVDFHTIVSTGNQTVLDASAWLDALAARDGVRSVALFLESDGDGERLALALARCAERGIGVAVLKAGESAEGGRAAAAHTGSVAGDQRVFRALVEEAGGAWARDPHELLELARVLAEPRARPAGGGGIAVLTCSGGDSSLAADEARRRGLPLARLDSGTEVALEDLLPDAATIANPLDYTAMIWGDTERLRRIVATVGGDPGVAQLLLLYDHPRDLSPESEDDWAAVREGLALGAAECKAAAIVASTLPDLVDEDANRELAAHGVPAVGGLTTALACLAALRRERGDPERLRRIGAAAAGLRVRSGSDEWMSEGQAKELLRAAGVAVPDGGEVADEDECVRVASEVGWPVVAKLSGSGLRHKSEAGAVMLGIEDEAALREAYRRLCDLPEAADARVLVEAMAPPGVEVLIAARADAVVPALVMGLGGIWTEALADVAVVPLPADTEAIGQALRRLRGAAALFGGRGRPAVDVDALATLTSHVGELLLSHTLELIELNPVLAHAEGATAVDALAS
jgi:acyl-CoA synthetase (NDP forming)